MKKILRLSLLVLLFLTACTTDKETTNKTEIIEEKIEYSFSTYQNAMIPITQSGWEYWTEIADPSVVRGDDGLFYIFSTIRRAFVSNDMCNWTVLTENLIPRPTWGDSEEFGRPDVWAPDVIKIKDKWIYYYSLAAWGKPAAGIGYAVSDNVSGPYTDMGLLMNTEGVGINGLIDPQPIIDNGRVYMLVGSFHGNYLVELTDDGMSLLGGAEKQNKEKVLIAGIPLEESIFNNSYYEGGYIIEKDGYYYFFGSAGGCCDGKNSSYRVYVGKAKTITGPYYSHDGRKLATNNGGNTIGKLALWSPPSADKNTAGPGHNSVLIDDAGDYWMIYHAYTILDNYKTRHLFMDKITWGDDGFPIVSYTYKNDNSEEKTVKCKPSLQIELDGPRFILEK